MTNFREKYGPWAIVTGASAGIGMAIAGELAARGVNIIGIARRKRLLDSLQEKLTTQYGVQVRTIRADLGDPESISKIELVTSDLEVGLVVPNAGIAVSGGFFSTSLQDNEKMLQLNMTSPMQLAKMFGAKMAQRGHGGILFISSLTGYQGVPYLANYAATKAYILTLGEALHAELRPCGIDVTVLSPGLTATDMPANMPFDFSGLPMPTQQAGQVAKTGIGALGRKATVVPGLLNKFYAWENRLLPRSVPVRLFGFLMRRALKTETERETAASAKRTTGNLISCPAAPNRAD